MRLTFRWTTTTTARFGMQDSHRASFKRRVYRGISCFYTLFNADRPLVDPARVICVSLSPRFPHSLHFDTAASESPHSMIDALLPFKSSFFNPLPTNLLLLKLSLANVSLIPIPTHSIKMPMQWNAEADAKVKALSHYSGSQTSFTNGGTAAGWHSPDLRAEVRQGRHREVERVHGPW